MNKNFQSMLLLPLAALDMACKQRSLPLGSKTEMINALLNAGVTPADIRAGAGMAAPAVDSAKTDAVIAEVASIRNGFNSFSHEVASVHEQVKRIAVNADAANAAMAGNMAALEATLSQVQAAAEAAGAVAARAESAALAVKPAKISGATVKAEVAAAVAEQFKPLGILLSQASPEVQAEVAAALAAPVEQRTVLDVFGIDLRDRKGNQLLVDIWGDATAPAVDPVYIWRESLLRHFVAAQCEVESLWLAGPKGTGKTQAAQQFAARTGRSFTRINFQKFTCPEDYVGAVGLESGATVYKPGDFLLAYCRPGAVILLDEITNADPGNLAVLNGYLEPGARVNAGGSVRSRATGVLILAADNSIGNGDDSGRYAGLRQMNSSLLDRFARAIVLDYLPAADEASALVKHTGCTRKLASHVVSCINTARSKVQTGDIIDAPSLRQAIGFIRAMRYMSVDEAWETTVASKQPPESAAAMTAVKAACLNNQLIEGEL